MRVDRDIFGVVGTWENWQNPETRVLVRTFAIVTMETNRLVSPICLRVPAGPQVNYGLMPLRSPRG
jgi:putative SOS response-associated peptidase YedK